MNRDFKVCTRCGVEKSSEEFSKNATKKDGLQTYCKLCLKEYREQNKERINARNRLYHAQNKDKASLRNHRYYEQNKSTCKLKRKEKYARSRELELKKNKKYREQNKELLKERKREYQIKNREKINANKRKKLKESVNLRIGCNLRSRLWKAIRGGYKSGSAVKDLGCSIEFLKKYLAERFYVHAVTGEEMSWDNYGDWHIDHIIPLASFDLEDRAQFLAACHYSNLQPLWAEDNLSKSDKVG